MNLEKKGTDAYGIWHFDKDGCLINKEGIRSNIALGRFLLGEHEVEKVKKEPWKPKLDEPYWYVSCFGNVFYTRYIHDKGHEYMLTHNLIFQTKKEAEDYKWFLDKVDEYKKTFGVCDKNYYFNYDPDVREVLKYYDDFCQNQGTIYFGDLENIDKFFEEVGEDRIKKYWFNVFEADE